MNAPLVELSRVVNFPDGTLGVFAHREGKRPDRQGALLCDLFVSGDDGRTWKLRSTVPEESHDLCEPAILARQTRGRPSHSEYDFHVAWRDSGVDYSANLDLKMIKPPLLLNGTGYVRLPSVDSGYYSQTRVKATGQVREFAMIEQTEGSLLFEGNGKNSFRGIFHRRLPVASLK